jgi:hypothetical protein
MKLWYTIISDKAKSLTKDQVFKEIKDYLTEQIELSRRKCVDEDNFSFPAWSEHQAFQLGFQKAFTKLYNLIPDQGEK